MEQALQTAVFYLSRSAMIFATVLATVVVLVAAAAMLRGLYNYIVRGEF